LGGFGLVFRLCAALDDEVALSGGEVRIVARITVEGVEEGEVDKADEPGYRKAPSPADVTHHDADERDADSGREFCGGVEYSCGETALLFGEPVAGGFGVGGERWSFADTEEEARSEQATDAAGDRGGEGCDAPEKRADATNQAHAEAIED